MAQARDLLVDRGRTDAISQPWKESGPGWSRRCTDRESPDRRRSGAEDGGSQQSHRGIAREP